jgi:hypothetical protein
MRIVLFLVFLILARTGLQAQNIQTITFNLYTDSLKKGFYNYISVDGQFSDGRWLPLDSTHLIFTANTGHFKGNDLFIDSAYKADSVRVKVMLRNNPLLWKETIIYIRKRGFDEPLKTDEEILNQPPRRQRKGRNIFF